MEFIEHELLRIKKIYVNWNDILRSDEWNV